MGMYWKQMAMEDLGEYRRRKAAVVNLRERMALLQEQFEGLHSPQMDSVPMKGGGNRVEDRLINNISERERLGALLRQNVGMVRMVERGLAQLEPEQRKVLEGFSFGLGGRGGDGSRAQALAMELSVDRATVYRMRDEALRRFTLAMFGAEGGK